MEDDWDPGAKGQTTEYGLKYICKAFSSVMGNETQLKQKVFFLEGIKETL